MHTQLAAVGKRLAALSALVRLLATVTPLVAFQRRLSGERLPADRTFEALVCAHSQHTGWSRVQGELRTVAMCQEVPLQLGLLRKGLVRTMAALPTTIIAMALRAVHGAHVLGYEVLLQRTGVQELGAAQGLDPILGRHPSTDV